MIFSGYWTDQLSPYTHPTISYRHLPQTMNLFLIQKAWVLDTQCRWCPRRFRPSEDVNKHSCSMAYAPETPWWHTILLPFCCIWRPHPLCILLSGRICYPIQLFTRPNPKLFSHWNAAYRYLRHRPGIILRLPLFANIVPAILYNEPKLYQCD